MEYGSAYLRPLKGSEEDGASMLSGSGHGSEYRPYRPEHRRQSSNVSTDRSSWLVSPVALQQSLPPLPSEDETSPRIRPALFSSRAVIDSPYHEEVAWENSTDFRPSAREESPKPEIPITVTSAAGAQSPRDTRQYFRHPRHFLEPWKIGFWKRFPWCGFGALFCIVLFTGVSAGILVASDDTTLHSWKVGKENTQPQVFISILEMLMNFLIVVALAEGVVIKFWHGLLGGSTLSNIHDVYESAFLWRAFSRIIRLRFNAVAIACLFAAISALRGPLFQRSSTLSVTNTTNADQAINLNIAPFPMPNYFQSAGSDPRMQGGLTSAFINVLRNVNAGTPLTLDQQVPDCGQHCSGNFTGFGFKVACQSSENSFDLSELPEQCKSCTTNTCRQQCAFQVQQDFSPTFFSVNYHTNNANEQNGTLVLTSVYKDEPSCKGNIKVQTCVLTQAKTDYDIVISKRTISRGLYDPAAMIYGDDMNLDTQLMAKYWPLAFESLFPPVAVNVTPSADFSKLQYSKCVISQNRTSASDGTPLLTSCSDGSGLQPTLVADDASINYATPAQNSSGQDSFCNLTWSNPMPDMINKMQFLAFYITVDMAQSNATAFASLRPSWAQSLRVTSTSTRTTYKTNKILVAVGVLLSVSGVAAILPLYMGFWELGRKVSLNPLEIARAFGAPLMDGVDGNATAEAVIMERGGMPVRYGALERYGAEKKLRVEESARATVRVPWQGEIFG